MHLDPVRPFSQLANDIYIAMFPIKIMGFLTLLQVTTHWKGCLGFCQLDTKQSYLGRGHFVEEHCLLHIGLRTCLWGTFLINDPSMQEGSDTPRPVALECMRKQPSKSWKQAGRPCSSMVLASFRASRILPWLPRPQSINHVNSFLLELLLISALSQQQKGHQSRSLAHPALV